MKRDGVMSGKTTKILDPTAHPMVGDAGLAPRVVSLGNNTLGVVSNAWRSYDVMANHFEEIAKDKIHEPFSEDSEYSTTILSKAYKKLPINQILSGDCLEILPTFPDGVFDCCITDPPFNMSKKKGLGWAFSSHVTMQEQWDIFSKDDYFQFSVNWIREVLRVLKTNGNLFIFGSFHCIFTIGFIIQNIFDRRIISQLVWYKPNAQPNITCRMFTESTEFIIWAVNNESSKAKNWTFNYDTMKAMNSGKQMRNMWEIPLTPRKEKKHGKHPSQKPLTVVNRVILAGTNEGDLILDPFSGSGTTAVVADQHNRKWTMIEKDNAYNQIAQMRIDEVSNGLFDENSMIEISPQNMMSHRPHV